MTVGFFVKGWFLWSEYHYVELHKTVCLSAVIILNFLHLSCLLWTNVVSFVLWKNLCSLKGTKCMNQKDRFFPYFIYGYGVPLLMTFLALLVDTVVVIPTEFKPNFDQCNSKQLNKLIRLQLFVPDVLIIFSNGIFFLLTARNMRRVQEELRSHAAAEETKQIYVKNLKRVRHFYDCDFYEVFLRLLLAMGVSWIIHPIIYFLLGDQWITDMLEAMHSSYGFFIFLSFIIKRNIYKMIRKRFHQVIGKIKSVDVCNFSF